MSKKAKNVSQADLRKLMSSRMTKKPTKRPNAAAASNSTTTEDLIALKKIKLLQEGKYGGKVAKKTETNSLVNKITHNSDKLQTTASKLAIPLNQDNHDEPKRAVPTGFFDDESEEKEKMVEIGYQKNPSAPTLASLEKEKINPRLKNQKKDGPRIKGVGVAKDLPAGFYDDKTKDANIRGVETPADKEKREWSEFTEAMNEEVVKSNQLLEQEDEYGNLARDIAEVDQQITQFTKIKTLADKAGECREQRIEKLTSKETAEVMEMSSDEDEEIDWRQQNIF